MRRREFIADLSGAAAAWPPEVFAQERTRRYRLGGLTPSPRDAPHYAALFAELRRFGFIEGQNLAVDWRGFGMRLEQYPDIARELVKVKVDVIFCAGDAAVRAAQHATTTVPILGVTDDMVGAGLVHSLAKPGGNTTGVSILATELDGKRQDILIEAVPGIRRMATLADMNTTTPQHLSVLQNAARTRGVELSVYRITKSEEVIPAIHAAKTSGMAALNVLASALLVAHRRGIIDRAKELQLPTVFQWAEIAEEGGLIAYGPRLIQMFRDLGSRQLIKLFRGEPPSDLPIEQPTHFELVINLRTAKAIGHEIPTGLALRADKLID